MGSPVTVSRERSFSLISRSTGASFFFSSNGQKPERSGSGMPVVVAVVIALPLFAISMDGSCISRQR